MPTDANNLAEDAPHVLIVDLAARQIVADLRLTGVKAGEVQVNDSGDTEDAYRIFRPGLAWDLARNRLYVVDADDDWITVVDLAERRILERARMHPRSSILDRIGRWLAPPAEAKAVPSTTRTAELSPDGKRLYVIGTEEGDSLNTMGLQVVDTHDLTVIRRLDVPATDVALSPDGRRLVLHPWWPASAGTPERQGVFTFDTDGPSERGHAYLGSPYFLFGVSPNSRYAYISDPVRTGEAVVTSLRVLDLRSSRVVAERTVDGGYADLFPVRRSADDN